MELKKLGFASFFEEQLTDIHDNRTIARVMVEYKHSYRVLSEEGEWLAAVSGHFAFQTSNHLDYPAVGDWVLVEKMPGEEKAIIHRLLKRKSVFVRKVAGLEIEQQIVAANVDIVFLVMSMNEDFNSRRLERYLTATWDSGATPMIVLTKADLCEDASPFLAEVQRIAPGVECLTTSTLTNEGVAGLSEVLCEGVTGTLLGSSGVGKSSLTNALLEAEQMKVSAIREDDARGRHTTTHRELLLLPSGGCLIDTPGMRELQLWDQRESLDASFQDIEGLAEGCRFRDCTHTTEPHCAVLSASEEGILEKERLQSYLKLGKEIAFLEKRLNMQAKLDEKRKQKKISKGVKRK